MLYVNGTPISKKDLELFNEKLRKGEEKVEKVAISKSGNVLIYTEGYSIEEE